MVPTRAPLPLWCFLTIRKRLPLEHAYCRELEFWFPAGSRKPITPARRIAAAPGDPKYEEMMAYMKEKVSRLGVVLYSSLWRLASLFIVNSDAIKFVPYVFARFSFNHGPAFRAQGETIIKYVVSASSLIGTSIYPPFGVHILHCCMFLTHDQYPTPILL